MPLPIIIFPHRHPDKVAINAMKKALPKLKELGYDTLCIEHPSDLTEKQIVATIDNTIQYTQKVCDDFLRKHEKRVTRNFSDMTLSELMRFISDVGQREPSPGTLAVWFKQSQGMRELLCFVKNAQSLSMEIRGFDHTQADLEPLHSRHAQMDMKKQVAAIKDLDDARTKAFANNLLKAQTTRGGVVCVLGQYHYPKLAALFSENACLGDVVFVHPYSPMLLEPSHDDRQLPSISHDGLSLLDHEINKPGDVDEFIARLNTLVANKIDEYRQVQPTQASINLAKVTGLPVDLWMRPSGYVDAYLPKNTGRDIKDIENKLEKRAITGYHVFFKGRNTLCVPCLNSPETGAKLNLKESAKTSTCAQNPEMPTCA